MFLIFNLLINLLINFLIYIYKVLFLFISYQIRSDVDSSCIYVKYFMG